MHYRKGEQGTHKDEDGKEDHVEDELLVGGGSVFGIEHLLYHDVLLVEYGSFCARKR